MMILYICEQCGRWQDVSIAKTLGDAWNKAIAETFPSAKVPSPEKQGVACPEGHGLMRMVQASDRLKIWQQWNDEVDNVAITAEETQETVRPRLTVVE